MKHPARFKAWLAVCTLMLLAVPALALQEDNTAGVLKVRVNAPPSWNILLEDRVAEVFANRIRDALARSGSDLRVGEIRPVEDPAKVPYLLTLNVTEWRLNRIGHIECTLDARLQTPAGERQFGGYTDTIPRWVDGFRRQTVSSPLEPSGEGSMADLGRDLARSGLLPIKRDASRDRLAGNT